jgi:glycerol kinase
MLPEIRPSSDPDRYGTTQAFGPLGGEVALTADLGDQQAATVGQFCFAPGEAKNTYGTGNFMLLNTGTDIVRSSNVLLTTVGYKFGTEPAVYALEGSIAVTGSAVQWLRDQLGIISRPVVAETTALGAAYAAGLAVGFWKSTDELRENWNEHQRWEPT